MKYVALVFGYIQEVAVHLGLSLRDLYILRWFINFMSSGKMQAISDEVTNEVFFWVDYEKVIFDNPLIGLTSTRRVKDVFDSLCGAEHEDRASEYPLKKKHLYPKTGGSLVYFAINREGYDKLWFGEKKEKETVKLDGIFEETKKSKKKRRNEFKTLLPEVHKVIHSVLTAKDSPFRHRLNDAGESVASLLLLKVEEYLCQIHAGRFLMLNDFDSSWLQTKNLKALEDLKGDWDKIEDVFSTLASLYGAYSKDKTNKLSVSLDSWIYNPVTHKSSFLTVLSMGLYGKKEHTVDSIKGTFDERTKRVLDYGYDEKWNEFTYWINVHSIYKYLLKYWNALKWYNAKEWKHRNVHNLMRDYINFMKHTATSPAVIGLDGFIWTNFMKKLEREDHISLEDGASVSASYEEYQRRLFLKRS